MNNVFKGLLIVLILTAQNSFSQISFVEAVWDSDTGLDDAYSIVVSTDGKFVYTVGYGDNAVVVFRRDGTTGKLTFVEFLKDEGTDGSGNLVDGLAGPDWVTLSPDDKHVYITSFWNSALVVFSRDVITGKLTFVEVLKDGGLDGSGNLIDGLNGAYFVTVSADGKHTYVASGSDNAVGVFSRDETTGKLTFVEVLKDDGIDGSGNVIDGLEKSISVTVSSDGKHVYACGLDDNAVAVFSRNISTGRLTFVEALKDDGTDGLGTLIDGLNGAIFVSVSPDGSHVFVAGRSDDAVAVFSRDSTSGRLAFVEFLQDGGTDSFGNLIEGIDRAISITVSSDGNHVYVAGSEDNAVAVFSRDGTTGRLTFVEVLLDGGSDNAGNFVDGLDAILAVTMSNENKNVYAASTGDNAVTVFSRDEISGKLTFMEFLPDGRMNGLDNPVDGLDGPKSIAMSMNDKHIYIAGQDDNILTVFSRDSTTGKPTFVEALRDNGTDGSNNAINGLNDVSSVTVSPDDKHVYAAGTLDNALVAFERDVTTGKLTFVELIQDGGPDGAGNLVDGLEDATSVIVSPDGKHVYATARSDKTVLVFARDVISAKLTFVEALEDGGTDSFGNLIEGLRVANFVIVSPDGKHVYAAGSGDDAIVVFSRDEMTGRLTYVEILQDGGTDGSGNVIDGLDFLQKLSFSPDGLYVYSAGDNDDAVVVFNRDAITGRLTFVEELQDGGTDGVGNVIDGLDGVQAVALSPDGKYVYAASDNDDALVMFSRDAATGKLSLVKTIHNGDTDARGRQTTGLDGATPVVVSNDGIHVYVGGFNDDAIVVFRVTTPTDVIELTSGVVPGKFFLQQNYPNPFNPSTKIRYNLPQSSWVTLTIYDVNGREVSRLIEGDKMSGFHEVIWDARDNIGEFVPSGIYLYRISAGEFSETKKLTVLR